MQNHPSCSRLALPLLPLAFASILLGCPPSGPTSAPTIVSFAAATPTTCKPTTVTLSWVSGDADTLSIDNGVGDVTGKTSIAVAVTKSTTFTLTATNALGATTTATTVTVYAFPSRPLAGTQVAALSGSIVLSEDHRRLAFPHAVSGAQFSAVICDGPSCADKAVVGPGYTAPYAVGMWLGEVNGDFTGFFASTAGNVQALRSYAEQAGVFGPGVAVNGLAGLYWVAATATSSGDDHLGVVTIDGSANNDVGFVEGTGGALAGGTLLVNNAAVSKAFVVGAGYAANGTPWIAYVSQPDVLTVVRRAGSFWSVAATASLNNGVASQWSVNGVAVGASNGHAFFIWAAPQGANETFSGRSFDLTTNTFGAPTTLMPNVAVATGNVWGSVALAADGKSGRFSFLTGDGRSWIGAINNNAPATPAAFHPELTLTGAEKVIYDSCDEPLVVYAAQPGAPDYRIEAAP